MKSKTIDIPIYYGKLVMVLSDNWEEVNLKYWNDIGDQFAAAVFQRDIKNFPRYIVAFNGKPEGKTIAHEVVHLVSHIFRDRGITMDPYNDEPQAYLTGFLFQEIEKFLRTIK